MSWRDECEKAAARWLDNNGTTANHLRDSMADTIERMSRVLADRAATIALHRIIDDLQLRNAARAVALVPLDVIKAIAAAERGDK